VNEGFVLIVSFVAGVLLTVLGAVLVVRFQRDRLKLGYRVLRAAPIIPFETSPGDKLRVVVKASSGGNRDGQASDQDSDYVDAGRVYGFDVLVRNTGNAMIRGDQGSEGLDVLIELCEPAVILSAMAGSPALRPEEVLVEEHYLSKSNVAKCWLKYLNPGEEATISVQSIGNACGSIRVTARSPGLGPVYDLEATETRLSSIIALAFAVPGGLALLAGGSWSTLEYGWVSSDLTADMPRGAVILALESAGTALLVAGMAFNAFTVWRSRVRRRWTGILLEDGLKQEK